MNDGGPAFPIYPRTQGMETRELKDQVGMSLRDYFAAKAMQAVITGQPEFENEKVISMAAYNMADAMLEARKK